MNGKEIILQRLRNSKNIKKFRFLEGEIKKQVFDFNAPKYDKYRKDENTMSFPTISKKKTYTDILAGIKPKWMSESTFKELKKNEDKKTKMLEMLDEAIAKYDAVSNKHFNDFVDFSEKQREVMLARGENHLFLINYIISGKFSDGTEFRAPFDLQEVEELKVNSITGDVEIIPGQKIYPNIPFVSWAGNKFDIDTEGPLRNITAITVEDDYISDFLSLYEKLGIRIGANYFKNLKMSELKLCVETNSIKVDAQLASHEAKQLVCALVYKFEIDGIDISNNYDVMNKVLANIDDDTDLESLITIALTPYTDLKLTYDKIVDDKANVDFNYCKEWLNKLAADDKAKTKIFNSCFESAKKIMKNNADKIKLYIKFLIEHKEMSADQIVEQWDSKQLIESLDSESNEIKFEKNKFNVEHVKLLAYCPELAEVDIFRDVESIFNDTKFIDNLLDSKFNEMTTNEMDESEVCWAFNADPSQQKAVYDTLKNDNTIIQGPPGTGKTQTILNIISNAMSKGQKVLVVAEKTTAVEVIKDRIAERAPFLDSFVLDLYNAEKGGIGFYSSMGDKLWTTYSRVLPHDYTVKPNFVNLQPKVDKIAKMAEKLKQMPLEQLAKANPKDSIKPEEMKLLESYGLDEVEEILNLTNDKIEYVENWKARKEAVLKFKSDHFPDNISDSKIKELYEYNQKIPYSSINRHQFASLLLSGTTKVGLFKKGKYSKLADRLKLDDLFGKDYKLFDEYIKFDFEKFNEANFENIRRVREIEKAGCSPSRLIEISQILNKGKDLENLKKEIKELDLLNFDDVNNKKMFQQAQRYLFEQWKAKAFGMDAANNQKAIREIIKCASRKKMTKVVKSLISTYWSYIYKAFPVVLCTPEVLSRYIPLRENLYDVVIIDEASQFLIERSIPALFRGKIHIISGDNQQLRPKIDNRFSSDTWQSDEAIKFNELVESESVLDLFEHLFGKSGTMLTTHYRSEKNELIDFSNKNFYEGKLNFIEDASMLATKCAITIKDVKGKWVDQSNQIEADEIIKLLEDLYKKDKDASVGVIVFSKRQANLIRQTLRRSTGDKIRPVLDSFESNKPNTLFIKSIDEVQGEERDVIIFGITYGNNVHNYMLLSEKFARNKINVAITRAKKHIYIIKSHKADEYRRIANSFNLNSGPETLFSFLKYAEDISSIKSDKAKPIIETDNDKKLVKYIDDLGEKIYKTITIRNKHFYVVKNANDFDIYYLIDFDSMADARNNIWFFDSLFRSKGYNPRPVRLTKLYNL